MQQARRVQLRQFGRVFGQANEADGAQILRDLAHHGLDFVAVQRAQPEVTLIGMADLQQQAQELLADEGAVIPLRFVEVVERAFAQQRPRLVVRVAALQCAQGRVDMLAPTAARQQLQRQIAPFVVLRLPKSLREISNIHERIQVANCDAMMAYRQSARKPGRA